jgi:hypothetical protein
MVFNGNKAVSRPTMKADPVAANTEAFISDNDILFIDSAGADEADNAADDATAVVDNAVAAAVAVDATEPKRATVVVVTFSDWLLLLCSSGGIMVVVDSILNPHKRL